MTTVAYTKKNAHAGKRNGMFLTLLLGMAGLLPASASATTQSSTFPVDIFVNIPCTGDTVELTGDLHEVFTVTINSSGGYHVKDQFNPQGLSGVDLMTGAKYQGTGVTNNEFNANVGVQQLFINNFRIIGQGQAANYLVHENEHLTVDANGNVTSFHDNFSVECK
jgi:hypothetical protein